MKKGKFRIRHIISGLVACYISYALISQQMIIQRLNGDIKKYEEEYKKIEESNSYLKDKIEYAKTSEYKEKMARERIGFIKKGETLYIIEEQN